MTIKNFIKNFIRKIKPNIKNVYMGCGDDSLPNYTGCDIRKTKTAKIICKAWELSNKVKNLENIYSRHMCEHLTYPEFKETLIDWYKALAPNGVVHIIVPNIDYHIMQWQNAVFDAENLYQEKSNLNWSIAGFYGWQRENYISNKNSATKYWDVHKSGYNDKLIRIFLEEAGFVHITCKILDNVHLSVKARKPIPHDFSLTSGERQISENIDEIRKDHLNRYNLSVDIIKKYLGNEYLNGMDIFCGNGYGSYILANNLNTTLTAYDGSQEAINYAQKYYKNENINYVYKEFPFELIPDNYNYIVSLESLEHIKQYRYFVNEVTRALKKNGILVISTPNGQKNNLIINNNPYHYRHYKTADIYAIFSNTNLEIIEMYGQDCYSINKNGQITGLLDEPDMAIKENYDGQFNIYVLKKH